MEKSMFHCCLWKEKPRTFGDFFADFGLHVLAMELKPASLGHASVNGFKFKAG
ncbi:hypothetical protein NP590_10310 [Methylomonas sp. SURF-2]|uniref:Uncharacterized protein n=1 Tax=Methylomonas subterranea TaxID=2952225 RepID=A0ABT1TGC0_9GAMM|nr:hypothetical protein [Methylomonas sp. SURF-2]MCQ8104496.1 hypothetical protein [Methylomonas sp. SURF-2]